MIDPNKVMEMGTELDRLVRENASLLIVLREMTYYSKESDNVYWKHNRLGVGDWMFGLLKPLHVASR